MKVQNQLIILVSLPGKVELKVPQYHGVHGGRGLGRYLLGVGADEGEDEAAVHDGQQVVEEKGQAGIEILHQFGVVFPPSHQVVNYATPENFEKSK